MTMHKQKKRETKQQLILAVAKKLFATNGYFGTTIDEIAQEADIGKGTVYNYFQNKEQLFYTIFSQINQPFVADLKTLQASDLDCEEKIREVILAFAHYYLTNHDILIIVIEEMKALSFMKKDALTSREMLVKKTLCQLNKLKEEDYGRYLLEVQNTFDVLQAILQEALDKKFLRNYPSDYLACTLFSKLLLLTFMGFITDAQEMARCVTENFLYGLKQ